MLIVDLPAKLFIKCSINGNSHRGTYQGIVHLDLAGSYLVLANVAISKKGTKS